MLNAYTVLCAVDTYYTVTVPTTYTVAVPDPVVYYYVTPVEVCFLLSYLGLGYSCFVSAEISQSSRRFLFGTKPQSNRFGIEYDIGLESQRGAFSDVDRSCRYPYWYSARHASMPTRVPFRRAGVVLTGGPPDLRRISRLRPRLSAPGGP